nr:Alpha/beta hydrolase family [uncultured bacterium]
MNLLTRRSAVLAAIAVTASLALALPASAATPASVVPSTTAAAKPTIVLVHGAWADSSSWAPVTSTLQLAGYTVLAPPNPLRGLTGDAAYLAAYLQQATTGPVVLVGHSYGGAVITNAALADPDVKALVYVDAFVPDVGESVGQLVAASTSALNVPDPTSIFTIVGYPGAPEGDADAYLKPAAFATLFAQDVPAIVRSPLAAGQRPITLSALGTPSATAAWKTLPSWYVIGTEDKVLPPAAQEAMAHRAGSKITKVKASHLVMISKPLVVAKVIGDAASAISQH